MNSEQLIKFYQELLERSRNLTEVDHTLIKQMILVRSKPNVVKF